MTEVHEALIGALGAPRVCRNVPLAPFTTFKVGGAADWLVTLRGADDVRRVAAIAREAGVPLTVLGGGSNVLVADAGIRGIVARIHGGEISAIADRLVRAGAGVTVNGLVRWTLSRGLAGVEEWAGTPGTVGGAVFGNAHFRGRLIGDLIDRVALVTEEGSIEEVPASAMEFGYDASRVQRTGEVVVSADFRVTPGDPDTLRAAARASLAYRKRTQPLASPSAGCIFQNPDPARDALPPGMPASAGALVDRAGLKGFHVGAARVSPLHANFIVNDGQASARDIRSLIDHCKRAVREQFGVVLREEIVYLGFDNPPTAGQEREWRH